jgi:hypothetical protein
MPIPDITFPHLSFAEANPALTGAQVGMNLIGQGITNQKGLAELPYASDLARATAAYKNAMANYLSSPNQALKYMSPLGKGYVEPGIVDAILKSRGVQNTQPGQGFEYNAPNAPQSEVNSGGGTDYNKKQDSVMDTYALKRQKESTDTQARNRNLFVTNIEKTISQINPEDLTRYSGILGMGKEGWEAIKSGFNSPSDEYIAHEVAARLAHQLSTQVRQFYGDSIQPQVKKDLDKLTNPSSWKYSPETAAELYKKYTNLLGMETGTYRGAMKSTAPYEEQPQQGFGNANEVSNQLNNGMPSKGKVKGDQGYVKMNANQKSIQMKTPDGITWDVPIDKLQEAIDIGARQVG